METNNNCKTVSELWRDSGKQMPFSEFCNMINSGQLDPYILQQEIADKPKQKGLNSKKKYKQIYAKPKNLVDVQNEKIEQPIDIKKEIATKPICPKKQNNTNTYLQIAAVGFIILGVVYLVTKKKN